MPLTEADGRRMRFWAEYELNLAKGGRLQVRVVDLMVAGARVSLV